VASISAACPGRGLVWRMIKRRRWNAAKDSQRIKALIWPDVPSASAADQPVRVPHGRGFVDPSQPPKKSSASANPCAPRPCVLMSGTLTCGAIDESDHLNQ